jgi:hypothetical protein
MTARIKPEAGGRGKIYTVGKLPSANRREISIFNSCRVRSVAVRQHRLLMSKSHTKWI